MIITVPAEREKDGGRQGGGGGNGRRSATQRGKWGRREGMTAARDVKETLPAMASVPERGTMETRVLDGVCNRAQEAPQTRAAGLEKNLGTGAPSPPTPTAKREGPHLGSTSADSRHRHHLMGSCLSSPPTAYYECTESSLLPTQTLLELRTAFSQTLLSCQQPTTPTANTPLPTTPTSATHLSSAVMGEADESPRLLWQRWRTKPSSPLSSLAPSNAVL